MRAEYRESTPASRHRIGFSTSWLVTLNAGDPGDVHRVEQRFKRPGYFLAQKIYLQLFQVRWPFVVETLRARYRRAVFKMHSPKEDGR